MLSPIPGSAALLARHRSGGKTRLSIIGSQQEPYRTDGGVDLFDCAGQGRIDVFFLSGGQIDGEANINLTGIGSYPEQDVRWSGAFGSAYLYFMVPRVILFREEHSRRVFVPKVDFISAPGTSPPNVYRPGGPHALVTGRCLFLFDRERRRFRLASVHPGHTVDEVRDETGFDFDCPNRCTRNTRSRCRDTRANPRRRRPSDRRSLPRLRAPDVVCRTRRLSRTVLSIPALQRTGSLPQRLSNARVTWRDRIVRASADAGVTTNACLLVDDQRVVVKAR